MKYDAFISYSRKDYDEVSRIINLIRSRIPEIKFWFDLECIQSGEEAFDNRILDAINESSCFIIALSDNSMDSEWAKDEVMYAKNIGRKVIPILLKGASMTGWFLLKFGRVNYVDSTKDVQLRELINNLSLWTNHPVVPNYCEREKVAETEVQQVLEQNTTVTGQSAETRTWQVGDYYNVAGKEGGVFWVDAKRVHGKIVSLDETELPWSLPDTFKWRYYPITGARDKKKGLSNLQVMMKISNWRERHPASVWCADHGPGWYLPAIEELRRLLLTESVVRSVNKTLGEIGGKQIVAQSQWDVYWSSTENQEKSAWGLDVDFNEEVCRDVTLSYRVRAVLSF